MINHLASSCEEKVTYPERYLADLTQIKIREVSHSSDQILVPSKYL